MDLEKNDDWNPDPNKQDSILQMQIVNFTDKKIKENKQSLNNQPFDAKHILEYANENWIDDDEDEELNQNQEINFNFQSTKQQLMNEQIFYHALEDIQNEDYITKKYQRKNKLDEKQVLSCANCFSQVSYNSQQHENYKKQFRAMITLNTKIDEQKIIKPEISQNLITNLLQEDEIFFSVKCKICFEEIGAYDIKTKMYHFFNVIAGLG